MTKRPILIVATIIVVIVCTVFLSACGSSNELVGKWSTKESATAPYGYPDQMTLKSDGTGTVDGVSCNWDSKDGRLIITASYVGTLEYDYVIAGSVLTLNNRIQYSKR